MRKVAILFGAALISSGSIFAQSQPALAPMAIKPALFEPSEHQKFKSHNQVSNIESSATTVFWSENFVNGIPSSWSQNGTPSTATWEYRGPSTTPNNNTGSRGAFAQGTGVIQSQSPANGFVIFDSDYLDNGGNAANAGMGPAPTPHIGRLMTDTIDLSGESAVELSFYSYARQFFTNYYVTFSKDGGATWNDTIELFTEVDVNDATDQDVNLSFNVSNYIGGESQAMIQFVFAGNKPGNVNGTGYYFWQLDDIQLRSLPENEIRFTDIGNAPAQDVTFNNDPSYTKYGILNDDQLVDVSFDANVYNYGSVTQTNVKLEVEIYDDNGTLLTTLASSAGASLPMLDSLDFNTLNTGSWTAPGVGTYEVLYKITSDSLTVNNTTAIDTVTLRVRENSYSLDWGVIDNFFGTNTAAGDMVACGVRFALENEDSDSSGAGLVFIDGVDILMSNLTDSTADLVIEIYDTAGFEFNAGFPGGTSPIYSKAFTLNSNMIGGLITFPFTELDSMYNNGNWTPIDVPISVPTGTYFVIVNFFPNAPDGVVRMANSAQYFQPIESAVFQTGDGDWFGGILNSDVFEAPFIRLNVADAPPYDVSIDESDINRFSVYPNPTNGAGSISFNQGGNYKLRLVDLVGKVHFEDEVSVNENEQRDFNFNDLKGGVYLLQIEGEGLNKTIKLRIQ